MFVQQGTAPERPADSHTSLGLVEHAAHPSRIAPSALPEVSVSRLVRRNLTEKI